MANQKQRRRRAKEKRHAYDLVEIDSEGNETVLSASDVKTESESRPKATPKAGKSKASKPPRGTPQPPSWARVLKRAAIFAPIFLATVLLLAGNRLTLAGAVVQTLFLLAIFVPFSYFMDRLVWRSHEKRRLRDAGR
jgi:Flp pilus assembly protein TadB